MNFEPVGLDQFDYVSNYFDLQDSLESVFNRKVDLVVRKGLKDNYSQLIKCK